MGDPFLVLFLVTRLKEVVAGHYAIWSKEQKMELRMVILIRFSGIIRSYTLLID